MRNVYNGQYVIDQEAWKYKFLEPMIKFGLAKTGMMQNQGGTIPGVYTDGTKLRRTLKMMNSDKGVRKFLDFVRPMPEGIEDINSMMESLKEMIQEVQNKEIYFPLDKSDTRIYNLLKY